MYELIQVGENTYYMDCPAKVGFYRTASDEVVLIDSGSDKDAGKKVRRILDEQGWKLRAIYNTHSHADHIGGNQYLQGQTGCRIFAPGIERDFTEHTILEATALYGGFAPKELHNKFIMAKGTPAEPLTDEVLPDGMEMIPLPGHSFDMVGFRTSDDVVFLADSVASAETLEKYGIGYLYDVRAYIETLETVRTLEASCFVPSHAPQTGDIADLAQLNIEKTQEITDMISDIISVPRSFEEILKKVFIRYEIPMNIQQNVLIGSTVKSYLSYLHEEGRAEYFFEDNCMLWRSV